MACRGSNGTGFPPQDSHRFSAWRLWKITSAGGALPPSDRGRTPARTSAATALGHNRLNAIARHTVLFDPADPERNPANPRRSHWQTDPVSGPLYQRLHDLAATNATKISTDD